MTLTGTVSSPGTLAYKWERETSPGSGTWVTVTGGTSNVLAYSSFETDATPSIIQFSLGSGPGQGSYEGKLYVVNLRLHVYRTLGGVQCDAYTPPTTVKKIVAVDP